MGMTLDEVLARFREEAQGNLAAMGAAFEVLVKSILLNAPVYRGKFRQVWLWGELHQGHDTGIDLVAVDEFGKLYGIQAKCYDSRYRVSKEDVDSFLSRLGNTILFEGEKRNFDHGMIFASTDNWTAHAEETLSNWKIPVQLISKSQLDSWEVNWAVLAGYATGAPTAEKALRDYQMEALNNAATYFATHDRGQLIMACGTGKTLTALRILEQECKGKGLALFLVPSIALLNQTLLAWSDDAQFPFHAVCVCSDANAHRRASSEDAVVAASTNALVLPPTTNAREIAKRIRYYRERDPETLIVVFSTYQSIEMVEQAQRELGRDAFAFDFAFCDEAHRTTGAIAKEEKEPAFTRIHSDENILVRKRLYMTATPRLYGKQVREKAETRDVELCDMNDTSLYGDVFFEISFGEAVARGYLTDYKVLVLTLEEDACRGLELYDKLSVEEKKALEGRYDDGRTTAIKILGSINALAKRLKDSPILNRYDAIPAHRAIAFCRTIDTSNAISSLFKRFAEDPRFNKVLRVNARHVDGTMSALERGDALSWIKRDAGPGICNLLCNVRCLSEGVDVPSMDAVIFMAKRKSMVEVAQSVGRVMRRAPGKQYGYVILPVVIPSGSSAEEELEKDENYELIWKVLNALRAHDRRFEAIVNQLQFDHGSINSTSPDEGTATTTFPSILVSNGLSEDDYGTLSVSEPNIVGEFEQDTLSLTFPANMERFRDLLYARVVEKCGNRKYFERWAADVGQIATHHVERLKELCEKDTTARKAFLKFHALLQSSAYATVSEEDARVMLAQQRLTGPIFDALFGNSDFTRHNPISKALEHASSLLNALETDDERKKLGHFYQDVRDRVSGIQSADGRLEIIRTLYDTFFASAFSATAKKLGIVFTPIEVVDFILRSADGTLRKYFGKRLSDKDVHILDPFTGTGTFIARLLQKDLGLIRDDDLYRKYTQELHANEIVLLSYYIAAVNIENVFHDRAGRKEKYSAFPGIVFGDTFRMREFSAQSSFSEPGFQENSQRIRAQNEAPITVIVGNPPYSVGERSATATGEGMNESYPLLEERITHSYALQTNAHTKKSLYDAYMKAFRWSSDVIANDRGGLVCFITNSGWLESNAGSGFRKSVVNEFDVIYCYNLRGNIRTFDKAEGGNIFNVMVGVAILLLIRLPADRHRGNASIYYRDIGDYLSTKEKLHQIDICNSFFNPTWVELATLLTPNNNGDWIAQRDCKFADYIALVPKKKFTADNHSFFNVSSWGTISRRDPWVYSFSRESLMGNMTRSITYYNNCVKQGKANENPHEIAWNPKTVKACQKRTYSPTFDVEKTRKSFFRPFFPQWHYFDSFWNWSLCQMPRLFPAIGTEDDTEENLVIFSHVDGSCLITNTVACLDIMKGQCFPLYWYEEKDVDLFGKRTLERHDGVSDWIQRRAERQYETAVTKEEIFYYVYGFLHQPAYRETFAADLKKSLPRIPLVERYEDFKKTSDIGRQLAALHLNYETLEPYPLEEKGDFSDTRVTKMKFGGKGGKDRSTLIVNNTLTLRGIPEVAYRYQVNGRSPIEWAVDRYQVRQDKASGIVNDPNLWAPENPRYIPDLVKRLVTLSIESLNLINELPPFTAE